MSEYLTRLQLFIRLWLKSIYGILLMVMIPVVALVIYNQAYYTVEDLMSMLYEEIAPIWFILILQWCFAIDFDSKFYRQILSYPMIRWKFLLEKLLFSAIMFLGLLSIVTFVLSIFTGVFAWQSLLFTMPIYITFASLIMAGTVIANHSVGGLVLGILFWMFYEFGGLFLNHLNVILIRYGSVYTFIKGETGFLAIENHWILYNRLFYLGIGILFLAFAVWRFNRKTV